MEKGGTLKKVEKTKERSGLKEKGKDKRIQKKNRKRRCGGVRKGERGEEGEEKTKERGEREREAKEKKKKTQEYRETGERNQ